jgi:hypothetical protein
MKRFTQNELFELRNHIPINALIKERLKMPSKISEGQFRFLCPLCGEFQTATNPKTNLGSWGHILICELRAFSG